MTRNQLFFSTIRKFLRLLLNCHADLKRPTFGYNTKLTRLEQYPKVLNYFCRPRICKTGRASQTTLWVKRKRRGKLNLTQPLRNLAFVQVAKPINCLADARSFFWLCKKHLYLHKNIYTNRQI